VLCEKVVTIIAEETVAENCSIMLLDDEQARLYLLAANDQMDKRYLLDSNAIGDKGRRLYSFRMGEGVAGTALKEGQTIYVPDTAASEFRFKPHQSSVPPGYPLGRQRKGYGGH
jgi:signal transduction protein with GAF and PtsI domain